MALNRVVLGGAVLGMLCGSWPLRSAWMYGPVAEEGRAPSRSKKRDSRTPWRGNKDNTSG